MSSIVLQVTGSSYFYSWLEDYVLRWLSFPRMLGVKMLFNNVLEISAFQSSLSNVQILCPYICLWNIQNMTKLLQNSIIIKLTVKFQLWLNLWQQITGISVISLHKVRELRKLWEHVACILKMNQRMTKPTTWHVRQAKTQISLGIRPVWSES